MKKVIITSVFSFMLFACGGKATKKDNSKSEVKEEVKVVEKNAYSPEKEAELVEQMKLCSRNVCDATMALIELGAKVGPKMEEIAANINSTEADRKKAFFVLDEIGAFKGGEKLLEAAKKGSEDDMRKQLFKATVATHNEKVIVDLLDYSISDEVVNNKDKHLKKHISTSFISHTEVKPVVIKWVKDNYSAKNEDHFTSLINTNLGVADVDYGSTIFENAKSTFNKIKLATALINLGQTDKIQFLIDTLKSKDKYESDSAARAFEFVGKSCPDDQKNDVIALIKKIQKVNIVGFDKSAFDRAIAQLQ